MMFFLLRKSSPVMTMKKMQNPLLFPQWVDRIFSVCSFVPSAIIQESFKCIVIIYIYVCVWYIYICVIYMYVIYIYIYIYVCDIYMMIYIYIWWYIYMIYIYMICDMYMWWYIYICDIYICDIYWLVVWNICFFIYWECHHPNWRTHIFQRGRLKPPTSIVYTVLSNILVCLTIPFPLKADRKFNSTSLYGEDPDRAEGIVGDGSYVSRFILHHLL